jgi:hypothetical protein
LTHEIARLLREVAYELIAVALPGLVAMAGILLFLHHLELDQLWLIQFAKDQSWLFGLFGVAAAYALGQIIQATGHVALYWLKLPWSLAVLALAAIERLPGLKWLKEKRYFRLLDVPDDRAELEKFKKSELFKRARSILAERSGLAAEQIAFENARDLALARFRRPSDEHVKELAQRDTVSRRLRWRCELRAPARCPRSTTTRRLQVSVLFARSRVVAQCAPTSAYCRS